MTNGMLSRYLIANTSNKISIFIIRFFKDKILTWWKY